MGVSRRRQPLSSWVRDRTWLSIVKSAQDMDKHEVFRVAQAVRSPWVEVSVLVRGW